MFRVGSRAERAEFKRPPYRVVYGPRALASAWLCRMTELIWPAVPAAARPPPRPIRGGMWRFFLVLFAPRSDHNTSQLPVYARARFPRRNLLCQLSPNHFFLTSTFLIVMDGPGFR